MPNRLLTNEEVNALFRDVGLEPPPNATPFVQVPDTITPAAWEQAIVDAPGHVQIVKICHHCWHKLVQTQMCCWCGKPWTLQHGPYLPEGDR